MTNNLAPTQTPAPAAHPSPAQPLDLLGRVDLLRLDASRRLDEGQRAELGQYMTPAPVARFMASLLEGASAHISILDAGAGIGSLSAAAVEELCTRELPPRSIILTAYEMDDKLIEYLQETVGLCQGQCQAAGISFTGEVVAGDFIEHAVSRLTPDMFTAWQGTNATNGASGAPGRSFNCAILNPPYRKIQTTSTPRQLLRRIGVETSNLYTGFLAASTQLLEPGGEMVAIVPRSFCNGTYFEGFRKWFLHEMSLRRLHIFESRTQAFKEDAVLQENIILHAVKSDDAPATVVISSNSGPDDALLSWREVEYSKVVDPSDPRAFINIVPDELGQHVVERMALLRASLPDLGLQVSTGRVVDFRAEEYLHAMPGADNDTVPLIYPTHLVAGQIEWPKEKSKKPNAILRAAASNNLLVPSVPSEHYVLVKRFSSKEERRRVVAAIYDPARMPAGVDLVGFENHLNYFHRNGRGLDPVIARGLAAYLNSTLLDMRFRQFSGHTQVNATDLRNMRYPTLEQLKALGAQLPDGPVDQQAIDALVEKELLGMTASDTPDPIAIVRRIEEARRILRDIGLPASLQNERSALVFLTLLDLRPDQEWFEASDPRRGTTPIMNWFAQHYRKQYKPNTRETIRDEVLAQFVYEGIALRNPDAPDTPVTSSKNAYAITPEVLDLVQSYGTPQWAAKLAEFKSRRPALIQQYAQERSASDLIVTLPSGETVPLSPSGQNPLIKQIVEVFASRYVPGAEVLYLGDARGKSLHLKTERLKELGISIEEHSKIPDVILFDPKRDWLIVAEAVTSGGAIDKKRRDDLKELFKGSKVGIVFVTAFPDRAMLRSLLPTISWETEVWIADDPNHLIHFNGERFLGPYPDTLPLIAPN